MKNLFRAIVVAPFLVAGAAQAMPCDGVDLELREAVQDVLTGADNPRISKWSGYLNDHFYTDLSCRLSHDMTAVDVLQHRDTPELLIERVMSSDMNRNQSDALMLILSAMQGTQE